MLSRNQIVLASLGILTALTILAVVGFALWHTEQLRVKPPDYCPAPTWPQERERFVVPGHTATLIDTSNEIPAEDVKRAFSRTESWISNTAPFLQRLSIYGLPASASDRTLRRCSLCVPKEGVEASYIYENAAFVGAEFRRFLETLQEMFDQLVGRPEAPQSPIIETMAGLVQRNEDLDSIMLVSDMLQHASRSSFYRSEDLLTDVCGEITRPGRLKAVFIYYIDRGLPDIQSPEWPDPRWERCLTGIRLERLN